MNDSSGNRTPDGSTELSQAEKDRTEALGTGASPESTDEDGEQDTASGGPADE